MADTRMGLAGADLDALGSSVVGAWDAFLDIAKELDPGKPTRLSGWNVREIVLHVGRWDDNQPLERILTSAREGGHGTLDNPDRANDDVVAAHRDASWSDILDAVQRARDGVEEFMAGPEVARLGQRMSASVLGPLPVLSILNAGSYELAVHANDMGVRDVPALHLAGLSAITDITGALVTRQGMTARATAQTPWGGWEMDADPDGWSTTLTPPGKVSGVAVLASAADILDMAAGRAFGPALLAQRRVKVQDLRRLIELSPIVEAVPGIPGGPLLRAATKVLSGAAGLLGRIPGVR